MVFESLVVDLINRFLGDYVENLDRSQLKLGIWGGDVNLKNLDIKENALDELDLPIKVISGHIGHLTLKIPWKNLYNSPVVALLDSVYVVAVPNMGVKYDLEKDEKNKQELKQKELKRIEDAKLKESMKGKEEEKKADTFTEKLVTQVIKNLQVKIVQIHIRYEDSFTNPSCPFAAGLTLHNLSLETTDDMWKPCVLQDDVKMIHKLVSLDGLAVYLNSNCTLFCKMDSELRESELAKAIATSKIKPSGMSYILGPINSVARLKLNPKPEVDGSGYTVPKVLLNLMMEEIAVGLTKSQYQRLMEFLDSMGRMTVATVFRKYRPDSPVIGNEKKWWKFAMNCVLEEDIRRKQRNWCWSNMKNHRMLCRLYRDAYKEKLTSKKMPKDLEAQIQSCEKTLDVFNITISRMQAEIEASYLAKKESKTSGGWFGGWFGFGGKKQEVEDTKGLDIAKKIEDAMTPNEKSKLYDAIGYQENVSPTEYPPEFIENKVQFVLQSLTVSIVDDTSSHPHVIKAKLNKVRADLEQRPSASALKAITSIESFVVYGCPVDVNNWPVIISSHSENETQMALLSVFFETNPLDQSCDQRLRVTSQSLQIVYDACSVNQLIGVLKPPEALSFEQLQVAASMKLDDFKELSAYGLQFAIERHQYLDLNIDLQPSIIIIPENGVFNNVGYQLLVNLGNFKMKSFERSMDQPTVRSLVKAGSTEEEILTTMMSEAYDKFNIQIQNVSVLMSRSGLYWESVASSKDSLYILQPMNVNVKFEKGIVFDDPRLPKMKISGELPLLKLSISDRKTSQLMKIAASIPLPESSTDTSAPSQPAHHLSMTMLADARALKQVTKSSSLVDNRPKEDKNVQLTDLILSFEIGEMSLELSRHSSEGECSMLCFSLFQLGTDLTMRTFDISVGIFLGSISMQNMEFQNFDGSPLYIMQTPALPGSNDKLFSLTYLSVDKKAPNFSTVYDSILQKLDVSFARLDVILHQEAILSAIEFGNYLMASLESGMPQKPKEKTLSSNRLLKAPSQLIIHRAKKTEKDLMNMKIDATLSSLGLIICNSKHQISSAKVAGLKAEVKIYTDKTCVSALLKDVLVSDPTPGAIHQKILSTVSGDVMNVSLDLFNDATEDNPHDMSAVDMRVAIHVGRMKVIYLNKYISAVLGFLNNFQAAKDKMAEASAAAAQVARQGLEDAYDKATRLALDITLLAPVIVVPQNSTSSDVLMVDLGTLKLTNQFRMPGKKNEIGQPAITDNMKLELNDFQLSRAIINPTLDRGIVVSECLLLQPVTFVLDVVRNLTIGWYKDEPEININGTLEAISVSLSQEDYSTVMLMLSENLGEGNDTLVETSGQEVITSTSISEVHSAPSSQAVSPDERLSSLGPVFKRVKFKLIMKSFAGALYQGSSNLESGVVARREGQSLARVELKGMSIIGQMLSDNSIWANIVLYNCILDDTRAVRKQGITRLMQSIGTNELNNMIDITYTQDSKGDTFVDLKVNSFTMIGCLEYLMVLGNFFTLPEKVEAPAVASLESSKVLKPPPKPTTSTMTIQVTLLKPDIVLIENIEDINSNAIIFHNEVALKLRISPDSQNLQASVTGLQLFTAKYNPELRLATMQQILNPCNICLTFNGFVDGDQRANVSMTDVVLHINPDTVNLIVNILSTLTVSNSDPDQVITNDDLNPDTVLWTPRSLASSKLWFLNTNAIKSAVEATESVGIELASSASPSPIKTEQMLMDITSILITVEAGIGKSVVPLVLVESSFHGEVRNWTSKLKVECDMTLEIACFNEKMAVWEPLIEPVEMNTRHRPWELQLKMSKNDDSLEMSDEGDSPSSEEMVFQPAVMSIQVLSSDILQMTVSKTSLDVLTNLGKAFGAAVDKSKSIKLDQPKAPYIIRNQLGIPMLIVLENTEFQVKGDMGGIKEVLLEPNTEVGLTMKEGERNMGLSVMRKQESRMDYFFNLKIETEFISCVRTVYLTRTDKRYYQLPLKTYPGDQWGFVVSVASASGSKVISLQSVVQIINHFDVPVDVFFAVPGKKEVLESCGVVESGEAFFVPAHALYTLKNELFFKPRGHAMSSHAFVWKDLVKEPTFEMKVFCEHKESKKFYIQIAGEMEQVLFEHTNKKTMLSAIYRLHLSPPVILRNLLPFSINFSIQCVNESHTLTAGASQAVPSAEVGRHGMEIQLLNYLDHDWTCFKVLESRMAVLSVWVFEAVGLDKRFTLELGMRAEHSHGSLVLSLYCPFWMINRTQEALTYRTDEMNVISHPANLNMPVLFSFKAKSFFAKKKASLRVKDSEWSDKFALDVVGSSGNVVTKTKTGQTYGVGVQIKLSSCGLTKLVIFTPFYVLVNSTKKVIECKETTEDSSWISVAPQDCCPFWPQEKKSNMVARFAGSTESTSPFSFKAEHETLLKLDDPLVGGINVECTVSEASIILSFTEFIKASTSALLVNYTLMPLTYQQKGLDKSVRLDGMNVVLYTWQEPTGERELIWSLGKALNQTNTLDRDGIGEFTDESGKQHFWVSFLDGMKRVLFFTGDILLAANAKSGELERVQQEYIVSLDGFGLSLVNNHLNQEVMYACIASTGVIWEGRKAKSTRYKALSMKDNLLIEAAYENYHKELETGTPPRYRVVLEGRLEIDFLDVMMHRPVKRHLRRSFQTGLWAQYKTSPHQVQIHAKINRLQIDNQLPDSIFPVVVSPVPVPKSVAAESIPKPFVELSLVQRIAEHSNMAQYQYFRVLVQEFQVKVDQGFLNSILSFFAAEETKNIDYEERLALDQKTADVDLKGLAADSFTQERKSFFDNLHLSPLKIHLSFSMTGASSSDQPTAIQSEVLNLLLQSIGVTLTEVQDVVFRFNYFERNNSFMTNSQLTNAAVSHYSSQAIKQFYVLLLGLDVIGNPVGLILGLKSGIGDFFYEPIKGAIEGPEEFAEGLALGVKSLLGHTVGGAAGAVSRITGTLGKGLAALTMDKDYQRKRQQQMSRRPQGVAQGFAQGGKGLIMGFVEGVTGVVTKPVTGAREEGASGFFKGVGKGLIGVVARPTAGAIDFASGSLDAVKKAVDVSDEVKRVRLPRFIHPDGIVRPYATFEAEGLKLLLEVEKGKYAITDSYVAHVPIPNDKHSYLMVTSHRIMYINKGDVFGQWNSEWNYTWDEVKDTPIITNKGIKILLKDHLKKKKGLGFFSSAESGKIVALTDPELCKWILDKMENSMRSSLQERRSSTSRWSSQGSSQDNSSVA